MLFFFLLKAFFSLAHDPYRPDIQISYPSWLWYANVHSYHTPNEATVVQCICSKKKVLQDSVFLGKRHQSRISCKVQSFKAGFPIITIVKGFPPCINSPCAAKIPTEQSNLLETTKIVYYQLIRTFLLDLVDQLYYFRQ